MYNGRIGLWLLTDNLEGSDEEKLQFPSWQDHCQDTIYFLPQREGIPRPCAPSVNKHHQIETSQVQKNME